LAKISAESSKSECLGTPTIKTLAESGVFATGRTRSIKSHATDAGCPPARLARHENLFEEPCCTALAPSDGLCAGLIASEQRATTFPYKDLGSVVSLRHRLCVAEIAGRVIGGFSGWLAWRVIHLASITSFRNKIAPVLD
jgi:NADH dehydrogenase FAD-containing subunit